MSKFIFVTGGVVSGLGKGITAASLGRLLKSRGLTIFVQKFDPYINIDPGNMSPLQHGEVYVTVDGCETDLDLGHYERFIDTELTRNSSITTGKIYQEVLAKDRRGEYNGATIQVVPHITNEIKSKVFLAAKESNADIIITEIGGTVGDIESLPHIETIRQIKSELGRDNVLFIHTTLVPYISASGELKTKPTQHSVKELRSLGIQPDIIVCRAEDELDDAVKSKIAMYCDVSKDCVFMAKDVKNVYTIPHNLREQGMDEVVCRLLHIEAPNFDFSKWDELLQNITTRKYILNVALVGKYVSLHDAYISVVEALKHGGYSYSSRIKIKWVDSEELNDDNAENLLSDVDGIVIPGGFGKRGIDGMISAAHYARVNNIPLLGIGLGLQVMTIEYARNICKLQDAASEEWSKETIHPIVSYAYDGSMRLGAHNIIIKENTIAYKAYGTNIASERHRHRYCINPRFINILQKNGLIFSGFSEDKKIAEFIEISNHPFYFGAQAHMEFKSRPTNNHPIFREFIKAVFEKSNQK